MKKLSRCLHCGQKISEPSLFENGSNGQNPDWLPSREWIAFLEMRVKIKKPLTDYGKKLELDKLEELTKSGENPKLVLQQSIVNCYLGLFPVHKESKNGLHTSPSMLETEKRREEEYRRRQGKK